MPLESTDKPAIKLHADTGRLSNELKIMALTKDKKYIPIMLAHLDDETESIDMMKEIIGMAESFDACDYIDAVLNSIPLLRESAPEWLENIIYRITNSKKHSDFFKKQLPLHKDKENIENYLQLFLAANPEKEKIINCIVNKQHF